MYLERSSQKHCGCNQFPSIDELQQVGWISVAYLLHPNNGGTEAISAKTQVNTQQAIAWSGLNTKLPSGLQMTNHLSKATTARDHRLTIPGMRQKKHSKHYIGAQIESADYSKSDTNQSHRQVLP